MRTVKIFFILMLCLLFLGCAENIRPAVSLLTGNNVEFEENNVTYAGRLGIKYDKTEAGFESIWLDNTQDDQHFYGLYVQQDLMNDPNIPLVGDLYLGGNVSLDFDSDGGKYGPYIGTRNNLGGIEILTEFHYSHFNKALAALNDQGDEKWAVYIGPRFKF